MTAPSRSKAPAAAPFQTDLFDTPPTCLQGFRYLGDLITAPEEAYLVEKLNALSFRAFDFHGYLANRQVVGFGLRYDFASGQVTSAPPIPDWLMALREAIGVFAQKPPAAFVQILINQYPPGAGIGWHRDKPQFDDVVGVSLLSAASLRFRLKAKETWIRQTMQINPRSGYLLSGPARSLWEHSICAHHELRYSITFRTLSGTT